MDGKRSAAAARTESQKHMQKNHGQRHVKPNRPNVPKTGGREGCTHYFRTLIPASSFCRSKSVCTTHTAVSVAPKQVREGRTDLVEHEDKGSVGEELVGAYRSKQLERVVYPVRPRVLLQVLLPQVPVRQERNVRHRGGPTKPIRIQTQIQTGRRMDGGWNGRERD